LPTIIAANEFRARFLGGGNAIWFKIIFLFDIFIFGFGNG